MGDLVKLAIFSLTYNQTSQLMSSLLSNYDPTIRPVIDQSKVVTITALMLLGAIRTVNEKEQTISIRLYCWIWWEDELLTWTPSDHGNITAISPQIQQLLVDTSEITPVYVNYTGTVVWAPNILLEQLCKMDMTKFPMDEHNCTFLIYSVGSSTSEISLQYAQKNLDLRQYTVNGEWELLKTETSILTFDTGVSP
ncbi:hypothetical protein RRG08_044350 [Elysia crispata]|uniref:Neurotransmitter-gated ion-channel ligand-binding domain-containing protein n=1 Tax=Elysia crispata TaxID=231223 RepID=A0AAE1DVS2_9GAST|nr:hypothetical protein RRG08_044350 [Elysia crispata]